MKTKHRIIYFIITVIVLMLGLYVHKSGNVFLRCHVSDTLVVIFAYFFLRTIYDFDTKKLAFSVVSLFYFLEFLQYFRIAQRFNIEKNAWTRLTLGTGFDLWDFFYYTIGIIIAFYSDRFISKINENK